MNNKRKTEDAIFSLILDPKSLTGEQKKTLAGFPNNQLEFEKLEKIRDAISHLPEKPMPVFLKIKLMHKMMRINFHFWRLFLGLSFLIVTSGGLLIMDDWSNLGQLFQIIIGCFISLLLIPMTFFVYFQYEKQSFEIEKRINDNLSQFINYFKKWKNINFNFKGIK